MKVTLYEQSQWLFGGLPH